GADNPNGYGMIGVAMEYEFDVQDSFTPTVFPTISFANGNGHNNSGNGYTFPATATTTTPTTTTTAAATTTFTATATANAANLVLLGNPHPAALQHQNHQLQRDLQRAGNNSYNSPISSNSSVESEDNTNINASASATANIMSNGSNPNTPSCINPVCSMTQWIMSKSYARGFVRRLTDLAEIMDQYSQSFRP
ncbi:hypothetical protein BX616_003479, partial [Lobosporangium transversale]